MKLFLTPLPVQSIDKNKDNSPRTPFLLSEKMTMNVFLNVSATLDWHKYIEKIVTFFSDVNSNKTKQLYTNLP